MTRYVRADDLRNIPFRTVIIEVSKELLADLLGQRFVDPDGNVISMEQVDIVFDPVSERLVATPLILRQVRDADSA